MKSFALAALVAVAAAAEPASIPSQTLNSFQAGALATLSAAQAALNSVNAQHVAENKASQDAALHSQSAVVHEQSPNSEDLGNLDESDSESDMSSVFEESTSGAAATSVAGSMLALALMAGVAMF
ncbi:hypothetical protein GGI07_002125 [Coemansia sp. Benny D115]|nr:hypothetical protein GGI07_002125 [Coemansia sp. Benny D115]